VPEFIYHKTVSHANANFVISIIPAHTRKYVVKLINIPVIMLAMLCANVAVDGVPKMSVLTISKPPATNVTKLHTCVMPVQDETLVF
jgi:hypothetical protein